MKPERDKNPDAVALGHLAAQRRREKTQALARRRGPSPSDEAVGDSMSVSPRLKPEPQLCPCGCGLTNRPRRRAWKDGLPPHVMSCPCRRCNAPRYKQRASRREHKVGKAVGGTRNIGSGAFGGSDVIGGVCEVEETSNQAVTRGVRRWWNSKTVQTKTARLYEHALRPRALVLSWDARDPALLEPDAPGRIKPQLAILTWEDFEQLCALAVEQRDSVA